MYGTIVPRVLFLLDIRATAIGDTELLVPMWESEEPPRRDHRIWGIKVGTRSTKPVADSRRQISPLYFVLCTESTDSLRSSTLSHS